MFVFQTGFGWKRRTPEVKTATFPENKLCNKSMRKINTIFTAVCTHLYR